jgi:four helix bundle protein
MRVGNAGTTLNLERGTLNFEERKAKQMTERKYDLEERLLTYAADIVRLTDMLPRSRAGAHVADQLLRSGTSPLSNHGEAQAAESRDDFIHKMSICLKELRESLRWLQLLIRVPLSKDLAEAQRLLTETEELVRIFKSSIRTAKEKGKANIERRTLNAER